MATPVVLYDWANPQQQHFAKLTKLLRAKFGLDRRFREFHHRYHFELALQRRAVKDELTQALSQNCISPYAFTRFQRTIRWKYADHPLCSVGTLALGGRFNVGRNLDPTTFPPFSAFYLAEDKETAISEALGQEVEPGITPAELALARPESIVTFSVSGKLDHVLDLTNPASLRDFVKVIKRFKIPPSLVSAAKHLPVARPELITDVPKLIRSLLNTNWRHVPILCEVPANSQIFGQLVLQAGIEGILYPSKLTGALCLAIFPSNFVGKSSSIQLDDEGPNLIGPRIIDATNWEAFERTSAEIAPSPLRTSAAS